MPKPFPLPITVGTDICDIKRIYDILIKGKYTPEPGVPEIRVKAKRFIHRVLNEQEVADAVRKNRLHLPTLENGTSDTKDAERIRAMAKFLAGRFAAKEAIIKAHSPLRLTFHDITVLGGKDGREERSTAPSAIIKALKDGPDSASEEDQTIPISISHDGEYATAVALGFNAPQALSSLMSADGSTPRNPTTPATKPSSTDYINPLEQTPTRKEPSKPELGIFTVTVDHLSPLIDKPTLLDIFRQYFSSVRWVTVKPHTYETNGIEYTSGFVTFGFRSDAQRAIKELNGLIVMGQSIKVSQAPRNLPGKREEDGGVWLFNDDLNVETRTAPEIQEQKKETEYKPPPPLESIFHDEPRITPPNSANSKPDVPDQLDDLFTWNSEEAIQTKTWDSITGEAIDPAELSEVMREVGLREARKRKEEEKKLSKEMRKFRSEVRGPLKIRYHKAAERGVTFVRDKKTFIIKP